MRPALAVTLPDNPHVRDCEFNGVTQLTALERAVVECWQGSVEETAIVTGLSPAMVEVATMSDEFQSALRSRDDWRPSLDPVASVEELDRIMTKFARGAIPRYVPKDPDNPDSTPHVAYEPVDHKNQIKAIETLYGRKGAMSPKNSVTNNTQVNVSLAEAMRGMDEKDYAPKQVPNETVDGDG